jgi:hypothetical protein
MTTEVIEQRRERIYRLIENHNLSEGLSFTDYMPYFGDSQKYHSLLKDIEDRKRPLTGDIAIILLCPTGITLEQAIPETELREGDNPIGRRNELIMELGECPELLNTSQSKK